MARTLVWLGQRHTKRLTAQPRERQSARIQRDARAWRLVWAEPDEIDSVRHYRHVLDSQFGSKQVAVPLAGGQHEPGTTSAALLFGPRKSSLPRRITPAEGTVRKGRGSSLHIEFRIVRVRDYGHFLGKRE